jgi:hypothetical protein
MIKALREGKMKYKSNCYTLVLYKNYKCNKDDPYDGLLESNLLIRVSYHL